MKEKPTLKHIAEEVGVTANTVSLALRDSPLVKPATKARIQAAARAMGYERNALAGSLRSGRSHTIALILGDLANPLFARKTKAVEAVFRREGYQVLILSTEEDAALELAAVRTAIGRKVDGVVLCPCQKGTQALALLDRHGIPYVLTGRHFGRNAHDAVVWDDVKGGRLATAHLLAQGCRRVLYLGAPLLISSARERGEGYMAAHEAAGMAVDPLLMREVSPMAGGVTRALDDAAAQGLAFDGLFAFSDLMALEAAAWLRTHGKRMPQDVRLAGVDDIQSAMHMPFGLTSVSADVAEETACLARLLLGRIEREREGQAYAVTVMDVALKVRESSGFPYGKEQP